MGREARAGARRAGAAEGKRGLGGEKDLTRRRGDAEGAWREGRRGGLEGGPHAEAQRGRGAEGRRGLGGGKYLTRRRGDAEGTWREGGKVFGGTGNKRKCPPPFGRISVLCTHTAHGTAKARQVSEIKLRFVRWSSATRRNAEKSVRYLLGPGWTLRLVRLSASTPPGWGRAGVVRKKRRNPIGPIGVSIRSPRKDSRTATTSSAVAEVQSE